MKYYYYYYSDGSNLDIVYHNNIITHNVQRWVMRWNGEMKEPALMGPGNETSALLWLVGL